MAERRESICNKCAHTDCVWKPIGAYEPPIFACITFKRKETTQADRIRAMSDEELAVFLCGISATNGCQACIAYDCCHNGHNGMPDWLQSPVDGGDPK